MKLSQKKTCTSCRGDRGRDGCDLRIKRGILKTILWTDFYKPLKPCLKPLTVSDFAEAMSDLDND